MWRLLVISFMISGTSDSSVQETCMNVTLTRGTTGLGVLLASERRGQGAIIERVVPDSAASHVLQAGDVLTAVAGVKISLWSLENINRLLRFQNRVKLQIRRASHLRLHESDAENQDAPSSASCYACIDGGTNNLHAFQCALAPFGGHLPSFSDKSSALPVIVAQPLDHCTRSQRINIDRFALLVSRGGCLPDVKARNAAWIGAEIMILVDGQYPPFRPIPTAAGDRPLVEMDAFKAHFRNRSIVNIPVIVIRNSTGYRIISEARDNGRDVAALFHAGPPTRSSVLPRRQVPLDEAEGLQNPRDSISLESSFRDGQLQLDFAEPGLPSGNGPAVVLQVACSLQALLSGVMTRVYFGKMVPCPICQGRGAPAEEMRPCKMCSSSGEPGIATVEHHHGVEVRQTLKTTCPLCHGFGEYPGRGSSRCERCKGERIIREQASLEVQIPKGAPDQLRIEYPGVGSQSLGRAAGNVEVVVNVEPDEMFERDGSTLHTDLPISLGEALMGFTREFQLLNGTTILLNRTQMTNHNDQIKVHGGGLPVWDPAGEAKTGTSASNGARTRGRETDDFGSVIITCTVAFPEHVGSDLKTLRMLEEEAL